MIELKQSQRSWIPLRLFDLNTSEPLTSVLFSAVTATFVKSDTSEVSYTPASGAFIEHTTGAAANSGIYQLHVLTSDVDTTGSLLYAVKSATSKVFVGSIKVVANEEYDTFSRLSEVSSSLGQELTRARQMNEGRWKIETSGVDANKMIFYASDGVTALMKFDLKDSSGNPTTNSPFERVPE